MHCDGQNYVSDLCSSGQYGTGLNPVLHLETYSAEQHLSHCLTAMIKPPDKGNLRKEGLILACVLEGDSQPWQ